MQTHFLNKGKFPVGDSVIYHFNKLIFNHIEAKCWIAGGAITSFLSGQKINDIDLFFYSRKEAARALIELRNKFDFKATLITENAIKGHAKINGERINIDVIKKIFIGKNQCIGEFDFTVCCLAVDRDSFTFHPTAPFDILRAKLVVNKLPFPVASVRRMTKYIKKGYSACNGTIMELLTEVRQTSDENFNLIEFYPID